MASPSSPSRVSGGNNDHADLAEENAQLARRVDQLKREKAELLLKLEEEEEYITNNLTRKLHALQKEKVDIENQLEMEQEFIVNRLQKQLEDARVGGAGAIGIGVDTAMASRRRSGSISSSHDPPPSPGVTDILRAEVNSLRNKINSMEQTHEHIVRQFHSTVHALKTAVLALRGLPDTPSARAELDVEFPEPDTSRPLLTPAPTPTPSGKEFAIPSSRARSRSRQTSIGETSNPFTPSTAVANS